VAEFDMPLEELRVYRPQAEEPADFDSFWQRSLAERRQHAASTRLELIDSGLAGIETWDVTFDGFAGHEIKGWLHLPGPPGSQRPNRLPAVVQFQGYGGGRGLAHEYVLWAMAGYAHFVMDNRGQGSGYILGDTDDPVGSGPATPGFMTKGISDPETHYFRRLFVDAVRAVEFVRGHPAVDPDQVAVSGMSQGGGLSLAVGGLVSGLVGVMSDVPFLCDFRRAARITDRDPYAEIARYLKTHRSEADEVFTTLSYFDAVSHARRAHAPGLFSVGLMDLTCPPSTVYAAYNSYAGAKQMRIYPFNDHEGGQAFQEIEQIRWLNELLR